MSKTKVLEVIRQGQIGGGESHLADLIELIDKKNFEPICLSFSHGEMITRLEELGVKCYVIETAKPFNITIQNRIKKIIKEEKISIIHAHGTRAASNVLFLSVFLGIPLIYTVHGWSFHNDQNIFTYTLRKWSERLICHFATRVICVSEGNAETGRKALHLTNPIVIKNGVNLNRFNTDRQTTLLRKDFGFDDSDFVIGFIARCTKQKNPIAFLEAIKEAHQSDNHIKGLFVGEGDMDSEVNDFIANNHMETYVYRSLFRTDIQDILPLIDVYCLPSLWEGLSIGLLEAMAAGCAIIATPTDGTLELITHEESGIVVPFNSTQEISNSILRLLRDKALLNKCQQNAAVLIKQKFNAQYVADSVADIYKWAFYKDTHPYIYD